MANAEMKEISSAKPGQLIKAPPRRDGNEQQPVS
jgi:hypothetical protein